MLTTQERNELVSQLKYLRDHPMVQMFGEGDVIELKLSDDDREMFACSESIARGDDCLSCGAKWTPDGVKGQRKLDHAHSCVYSNRLMEEDL